MKKLVLILTLATFASFTLQAQNNRVKKAGDLKPAAWDKPVPVAKNVTGNEIIPLQTQNQAVLNHSALKSAAQTQIGITTYDLQSNAAMDDRLWHDGNITVGVWTFSLTNDLGAADRGSGYNSDNGLGWGTPPTVRVESTRIGWPSIGITSSGKEHIVSHTGAGMNYTSRPTAGSGAWTDIAIPNNPANIQNLWPRMAIGGTSNNTLHMIDITTPTGNGGVIFNGLDGHITYSRSVDEGATWGVLHSTAIPGMDSTLYAGMGADAYSIDARGDVVAFTSGRIDIDWAMWKSVDNGTTWTKTVIQQWPFPLYDDVNGITDVDGDGIADTVQTTDGKVAILIDNNGMVHAWAGAMLVFDDVIADPLGLFLSTDGLLYWNETMGANPPVVIAQSPDRDGDGSLTFAADYAPRYGNGGQTSQPSASSDAFGNIVCTYVTLMENTSSGNPTPGDFSYRNTFMIGSEDGGATWGTPFNVSASDFDEAVFPSAGKQINGGCIDVVWQQDGLPGIAVQAPDGNQALHPFGNNDIIHDCVSITNVVAGIRENKIDGLSINVYPNPASDYLVLAYNFENATSVKIEIVNALGQVVRTVAEQQMTVGERAITIDISDLRSGVYTVNTISGSAVVPNRFVID